MSVNTAGAFGSEEMAGSPKFNITKTGVSATRVLRMDWDTAYSAVEELFGQSYVAGVGVVRTAIHTFPGKPFLILESANIDPHDPANPTQTTIGGNITNRYESGALITLQYKTQPWDQEENSNEDDPDTPAGTYLTHRWSLSGEILTLPHSGLEWQNANADGDQDVAADLVPAQVIPTVEHQFTWHFVPNPPFATIRDMFGKVNSAAFGGAATETLLFLGAEAQRDITTDGERTWTLDYRFQEKAIKAGGTIATWNHFYRPDAGNAVNPWQRILRKSDGKPVYELGDFSSLFEFDALAG